MERSDLTMVMVMMMMMKMMTIALVSRRTPTVAQTELTFLASPKRKKDSCFGYAQGVCSPCSGNMDSHICLE
jgi:hypothetical protein